MEAPPLALEPDPSALSLGTRIGAWQIVGYRGRGGYGTVYRAVREGHEEAGPVALKMAVYPRDPRYDHEAVLLSRILHPSVPRLIDAGLWRHSSGFIHPYLVMEWIAGEPLYRWAAHRNPSSRQVLRLLAQGAHALRAAHAVDGVHRDVKGDNVLVRPVDDRLILMDFGSGHYEGAERLTPPPVPPGTPAYQSPEVWDYARRFGRLPYARYVARPADDVFAFGVMAYRLVTDEYPPFTDSSRKEGQCWQPGSGGPRPPKVLNPRVDPQLDGLILRMLDLRPEERGTAEQLAKEMEQRAEQAGPEADVPLFEWETLPRGEWPPEDWVDAGLGGPRPRRRDREEVRIALQADAAAQAKAKQQEAEAAPTQAVVLIEGTMPGARNRRWRPWLQVAAVGAMVLWPRGTGTGRAEEESLGVRCSPEVGGMQAGSVSVGDTALTSSEASGRALAGKGAAVESPPQPLPGQLKPDANGRCRKGLVALNGGCWVKTTVDRDVCAGNVFVHKGDCYVPIFPPVREPTSAPVK